MTKKGNNGHNSINGNHKRFHFQMIRPDEHKQNNEKFKTSQSSGIDGISSSFLKIATPVIGPSLCSIFNTSISRGCSPGDWKIARVSPIYKDGSTEDRSNHRPTSVLSVLSRSFEKIVFDQVYNYFTENEFFYSDQSGFRLCHSVLACLLKCTNDWYLSFDKGLKSLKESQGNDKGLESLKESL